MSSRSASKTCLRWLRVLRLKVSWFMASASVLSFSSANRLTRAPWVAASARTRTKVLRLEADAAGMAKLLALDATPMPPAVSWRAQTFAPRGPGVATSLGSKDIEGVRAHGERATWTIEAGKVGNEKPIVITRDVWTSPELMVTLLTTDNDPRSGQTIYRLAKLQRGEPDAALMRVPADYSSTPPPRCKTKP
jgi:hypothetical protein